jgi:hypothetical protein
MSRILKRGWFSGIVKYEKGTYKWNELTLKSFVPDLKVEVEVEDILETIEKSDSGQNKAQQKIKPSFLKNEFLHLKERFKKRRFSE